MRRVLVIWLVQLLMLGFAIGTEEQTNAKALVIDAYWVKASGVAQEKGFASWARDLREGKASLTQYQKILHAEYPLAEAFDIANEAQAEADTPKFVVAGHVAPRVEQGAYKITFSELGRPPAYSGQTSLTIRMQDRRGANAASYRFGAGWHTGDCGFNPVQNQRSGRRREIALRDLVGRAWRQAERSLA
jgi:hypothetical protein